MKQSERLWRLDHATTVGLSSSFNGELLSLDVLQSITLHPIKIPGEFYRLDNFLLQRRIMELRQRQLALRREIVAHIEPPRPREFPLKRTDVHDFDFISNYELFASSFQAPRRGFEGFWRRTLKELKRELNELLFRLQADRHRGRNGLVQMYNIDYGHMRYHPLRGLEVIMQISQPIERRFLVRRALAALLFRVDDLQSAHSIRFDQHQNRAEEAEEDTSSTFFSFINIFRSQVKTKKQQRRDDLEMDGPPQEASSLSLASVPFSDPRHSEWHVDEQIVNKTVNFVMPLKGRWSTFRRFMVNWERVVLGDKHERHVRLVVVLFEKQPKAVATTTSRQSELTVRLFERLRAKYGDRQLHMDTLRLVVVRNASGAGGGGGGGGEFSRSVGCETGAALFNVDDLLFFIDVDIVFDAGFLARVRLNTIRNRQVYYPIVFSQYDNMHVDIVDAIGGALNKKSKNNKSQGGEAEYDFREAKGFWRQFGYGMLGAYLDDLRKVGGFDQTIVGWGYEDVDVLAKFIKHNMTLLRSVDPGLVHIFHRMECNAAKLNAQQMKMCTGSKASLVASQRRFANFVYQRKDSLLKNVQ